MAEGARLESVCAGNRTEGSNPSLSAMQTLVNGCWKQARLTLGGSVPTNNQKMEDHVIICSGASDGRGGGG